METELGLSKEENGRTGVRGELFLNFEEAGRIQKYLMENSGSFGFELSPEPVVDANKKNSKKKSVSGGAKVNPAGFVTGEKKKSRSSRPSYSRELKALLEDGMSILESKHESKGGSSQSSVGQRGSVDDSQRKLPDWAKRFHRILKVISQQEAFSPFVSTVNIKNFDSYIKGDVFFSRVDDEEGICDGRPSDENKNKEIDRLFLNAKQFFKYIERCSPIKPISLNCIISKLENNEYSSAAHVFSDVYSVWICGFRSVEPGKTLWTKAVDASLNFNLKLLNEPLQDDFLLTYPGGTPKGSTKNVKSTIDGSLGLEPPKKIQNTGKNSNSLLFDGSGKDSSYQTFSRSKKSTSNNQSSQNSSGSKSNKASKKHFQAPSSYSAKGITEPERHEFQSLLSQLSQNDHVELFNSFFSTAHWKEVNSGEVELDDQQTPPNVFREMIKWCKVKLNIPVLEDTSSRKDSSSSSKNACKKTRQQKAPSGIHSSQKKKSHLSAKQFFSSGRAFSSPSSSSASEDEDDISLSGNLQISQQWASTSSSGESDNEPELTSFYPHFNSK
ncbi:ABC transporter [Cryptosporidium sp. chipmunk genotype I]|uniref:ABC transporter n=1 Tax=Cryptosporidium sp. chipmunk genotype I TaxID=1280935 RepID=UPI003519E080|nr:ABC transporter [Cryptosporidium sp. chipmunk genotype I]